MKSFLNKLTRNIIFHFIMICNKPMYSNDFSVNGKTFKSINGESLKQKEKRGRELSGNQKVLYVAENPNISRLCAIAARHTNKTAFFILVAILALALRCVCSTDIIPTVRDFPANFAETKAELSEIVSDFSENYFE